MKQFSTFLFLATVFLFAAVRAHPQTPAPTKDFEFWNDTVVAVPLVKKKDGKDKGGDKLSLLFLGTFRAGDNLSRPIDERIGAGFDFVFNKYVTLTPSYLYRAAQPVPRGREYEHRVRLDTTLGKKWEYFSVRDRNRFEYRIRNSRDDTVRYRNKFTFSVPVKKEKKELFAPFVATEPFYDFREKRWTRNELSVGVSRKLWSNASADFFYLWQFNPETTLKNVNVIGVNLRFRVDRWVN